MVQPECPPFASKTHSGPHSLRRSSEFSPSPSSSLFSSQGTVNNQTGIFPQSFVKIIKPLPDSNTEGEGEGHTYSCLRCFLLTPSGVDTRCWFCAETRHVSHFICGWIPKLIISVVSSCRDVCVEEDLMTQPTYKDLLFHMRFVQQQFMFLTLSMYIKCL